MSSTSSSKASRSSDNLTSFNLTDLPPMTFPPLPPINDAKLYEIVVSHSSLFQGPKKTMNLNPETMVLDYEKLEHVGDALLGAMIMVLLHDLFPLLGEGPATVSLPPSLYQAGTTLGLTAQTLKGCLVSNATLARISTQYGIHRLLKASPSAARVTRTLTKIQASMFEAWVAGVFYAALSVGESGSGDEEAEGVEEGYTADAEEDAEEVEEVVRELAAKVQADSELEVNEVGPDLTSTSASTSHPCGHSTPSAHPTETEPEVPTDARTTSHGPTTPAQARTSGSPTTATASSPVLKEADSDIETSSDICTSSPRATSPSPSPAQVLGQRSQSSPAARTPVVAGANLKYRWLAMTLLDEWLRPLFTPIALHALDKLREQQIRLEALPPGLSGKQILSPEVLKENGEAVGAVSLLEMHLGKDRANRSVRYTFEQVGGDWHVSCAYKEAEGTVVSASAVRANQRTAKALAAHRVCDAMGLERPDQGKDLALE